MAIKPTLFYVLQGYVATAITAMVAFESYLSGRGLIN